MEDVLEVYARPRDPDLPLVCLDGFSRQIVSELKTPLACGPGKPARYDSGYVREGVISAFMMCSPHGGTREVFISGSGKRKTRDYALALEHLADKVYPRARKIILVQDNLNTHRMASLYAVFAPQKALRLARRFEVHYTPKHGSWLNIAEIEISALSRSCLDRRIGSGESFRSEIKACVDDTNRDPAPVKWQFCIDNARIKLASLYPSI